MRMKGFERVLGGVCAPEGFTASGVACGIKENGRPDLALVHSRFPASSAGVFTSNSLEAAPVALTRERVAGGRARAVLVNSGNANAMTGERGKGDALDSAAAVEEALGIPTGQALVASTGIIGEYLPMDRLMGGIRQVVSELSTGGNSDAARAIMTTDTYPKELAVEMEINGKVVRMGAMAKGSGMIHPDMATMICVICTDARLEPGTMSGWLNRAVKWSFNRITVDGDRSTNDTVLMLANGAAASEGHSLSENEEELFFRALCWLTGNLALALVRDGEGTSKLLRIVVNEARDDAEAVAVARAIANSNLVRCGLYGGLPAWGRIAAAAGSAGVRLDASKLDIFLGEQRVAAGGIPASYDEVELEKTLRRDEVEVTVNLGLGAGSAYFLGGDLTEEYVKLNSGEKS